MPEVHEGELNVRITDLLNEEFDLDCRPERPVHGRRPDIRCFYNELRIAIEASYNHSNAERDAKDRIEQGLADIAVALHYAEKYHDVPINELERKLRASRFNAKVISPKELSGLDRYIMDKVKVAKDQGGWFTNIGLETLVDIIRHASAYLINEEEVEKEVDNVKEVIDEFVKVTRNVDTNQVISGKVAEILYRLYGFNVAQAKDVEIVFSQAALAILLSTVFYERMRTVHGLKPVDEYIEAEKPIAGLKDALKEMLRINYEPALKVAYEILNVLPVDLANAVGRLINEAVRISQMPHLLARDFVGRVYHEIAGNIAVRKGFATYYTEVPAAYLLASLALKTLLNIDDLRSVKPEDAEKIIDRVRGLKIADFACGSGTLLTASLYNASRIMRALCFMHDLKDCPSNIEKALIEGGIYGLDALRYAAQITAINLALMSPEPVSRENVYAVYLGVLPNKGAWLGSLELLQNGGKVGGILQWIEGGLKGAMEEVSVTSAEGKQIELPSSYDLIIMNPPFTRATGRVSKEFEEGQKSFFGFITDKETREVVTKRYDDLRDEVRNSLIEIAEALFKTEKNSLKNLSILSTYEEAKKNDLDQYYSIGQAGEGLLFLYLAYKYVEPGGVIAFVLPRNVLSGVSWFLARALLASKFHLKYVIVSSDGEGGYNFSEGTNLSEALIIAKRVDEHVDDEATYFIELLKKPRTALEALIYTDRIAEAINEGRQYVILESGTVVKIRRASRRELLDYLINWGVFFLDEELLSQLRGLTERGVIGNVTVPITLFNDLIRDMGVNRGGDVIEAFNLKVSGNRVDCSAYEDKPSAPYIPMVCGSGKSVASTIEIKPNAYIPIPSQVNSKARRIMDLQTRLLVPNRIGWDTYHAVAHLVTEPVIANVYFMVKTELDDRRLKALVLWLNSFWSLLTIYSLMEVTGGAFTRLNIGQWKLLPILDVRKLNEDALVCMEKTYDLVKDKNYGALIDQFNNDARVELDLGIVRCLNIAMGLDELRKLYSIFHLALSHMSQ